MSEEKNGNGNGGVPHKDLQFAVKDITEVLGTKQNIIAGRKVLVTFIVNSIGGLIGTDAEGNPTWTDDRAAQLKPETLTTYEALVNSPEGQAVMAEAGAEAGPAEQAETEVATEETSEQPQECPSFGKDQDPNDEACQACTRTEECAAAMEAVATKPARKTKEERLAEAEAKKAEREAAKAQKQADREAARAVTKVTNNKYSYMDAFNAAIKEGPETIQNIIQKVCKNYQDNRGLCSMKQAERNVITFLRPLLYLGFASEKDGKITVSNS